VKVTSTGRALCCVCVAVIAEVDGAVGRDPALSQAAARIHSPRIIECRIAGSF
jgi:hypothetical protein